MVTAFAWPSIALACAGQAANGTPSTDRIIFFLLAIGLGFLWHAYRSEHQPEFKIRLAAMAGLISTVFLAVTAAMPWVTVGVTGDSAGVPCLPNQEMACLYAADWSSPTFLSEPIATLAADMSWWRGASGALHLAQITVLTLLLPALIWLIVDPRSRGAQATCAVGATVAALAFLLTLLYVSAVPEWAMAEHAWTSDIALLTSGTIVCAAVLIIRQGLSYASPPSPLPRAVPTHGSSPVD